MSRARDTAGIIQYNKISIDSNNAVGIGSSIPDCKLDINGGLRVVGVSTFESNVQLGDSVKAYFGDSNDLEIYHDSSHSRIVDSGTGHLIIQTSELDLMNAAGGEDMLKATQNGSVEIYYDASKKFETTGGGINITGITTADAFSGFEYLQAPHAESVVDFSVTIAAKTTGHRYDGTGSSNGYVINGVESPFLTLTPGITYRFNLSSSDMSSHPFRFYLEADKTTAYTTNVTSTATYTEIEVTDTTPSVLHYQCSSHAYMGNAVQVNSNKIDTPYRIDVVAGGADITGIVTATSFEGDGSSLSNLNIPATFDWRDGSLFS